MRRVSTPRHRDSHQPREPPAAPVVVAKPRTVPTGPARLFVLDTNVLMHDPMSPVPLRGTRRLPADDHAGGTRQPQERHERGGAQRAPGQPRPRRAGRGQPSWNPDRTASRSTRPASARRGGRLFFQTDAARRQAAERPAAGQGRQPDPRRRPVAARATTRARRRAGVERHQHAHQGARSGPARRGLRERQDARRLRPAVHRRAAAAGRLLGAPRQDDGELEPGRPHLLSHRRPAGAGADDQPVPLPQRRATRRCTPA